MKQNGGEGGIRTPETFAGLPALQAGALDHYATSPCLLYIKEDLLLMGNSEFYSANICTRSKTMSILIINNAKIICHS